MYNPGPLDRSSVKKDVQSFEKNGSGVCMVAQDEHSKLVYLLVRVQTSQDCFFYCRSADRVTIFAPVLRLLFLLRLQFVKLASC